MALALATACGGGAGPPEQQVASGSGDSGTQRAEDDLSSGKSRGATAPTDKRNGAAATPNTSNRDGTPSGTRGGEETPAPGRQPRSEKPQPDPAAAPLPAPGTYTFAQTGYEEFCPKSLSCDRIPLPSTQTARVTVKSSTPEAPLYEISAQVSKSRYTRSLIAFPQGGVELVSGYQKIEYGGLSYVDEYAPEPPVRLWAWRLPRGGVWKGEWEGALSGTYEARRVRAATLQIAGRSVRAVLVTSTTRFWGERSGTAELSAWIDPRTSQIVKAGGSIEAGSDVGAYNTHFEIELQRGPGYE